MRVSVNCSVGAKLLIKAELPLLQKLGLGNYLTNIFLGFLLIVSEVAGLCFNLRCLNYLWTGLMLIRAEMGGSGECSLCFFSQAY